MVTQQSYIIPRGAERLERLGSGKWEERVGRGGGGCKDWVWNKTSTYEEYSSF